MKQLIMKIVRIFGFFATLPARARQFQVSEPNNVSHSKWVDYLSEHYNKPGMRVLEIGSRVVTGANYRSKFDNVDYVGFDFLPGPNVDVVGDAHKLSELFEEESFDLIFSSAVFEHLYMPWVVAEEIQKILKVGGYIFVETHFSFNAHERPWNFFQFSEMGLRALFNDGLGFELIDYGLSNPMMGYFSHKADKYLRYSPAVELYCHSEIMCRKKETVKDFSWNDLDLDEVVNSTRYPLPKD